jgi:hypothetical protein
VLSQISALLTKGLGLLTYAFAWQYLALFELSAEPLWVWGLAFALYDFCYCWNHRLDYECNVLCAAHSVHHQRGLQLVHGPTPDQHGLYLCLDFLPAYGAAGHNAGGFF